MMRHRLILVLALLVHVAPAFAVKPGEQLADPALEQRARKLSSELRCLVCQNQSIDDSDAALAEDLRKLVRERIAAGDSDRAIREFLVARYGDFVLLKPPFSASTLLLWGVPGLALALGIGAAAGLFRRSRGDAAIGEPQPTSLTEAEKHDLEALLKDKSAR